MSTSGKRNKDERKKKKDSSWLMNYIEKVMQQSMKECLDKAIDDLLKDWK